MKLAGLIGAAAAFLMLLYWPIHRQYEINRSDRLVASPHATNAAAPVAPDFIQRWGVIAATPTTTPAAPVPAVPAPVMPVVPPPAPASAAPSLPTQPARRAFEHAHAQALRASAPHPHHAHDDGDVCAAHHMRREDYVRDNGWKMWHCVR